jgi:hypothetical protein
MKHDTNINEVLVYWENYTYPRHQLTSYAPYNFLENIFQYLAGTKKYQWRNATGDEISAIVAGIWQH